MGRLLLEIWNFSVFLPHEYTDYLMFPKKLEKTGKLEKNWITINTVYREASD